MSGIVAILHQDGSPVDKALLRHLTESMAFRGPDALDVKLVDSVGLGHAMLSTGFESEGRSQPCTLDGDTWICADARIDDRQVLFQRLRNQGRADLERASDAELILHAYQVWGLESPAHFLGDFSFVIWDRRKRRLFCARDHFGVKPLFYARVEGSILVSNTVDTLRLHPQVSDELDSQAIADYLLFSFHQDPEATDFANVRRVPAAHALVWERGGLSIDRYWSLPVEETLRYKNNRDYVDHFNEVFGNAVGDRLRSPRVAIRMSGGLDSTAIAATARRVSKDASRPIQIHAFTGVYEQLIPDQEGTWARMVADELNIPIHFTVGDSDESLQEASSPPQQLVVDPLLQAIADFGRVALTGFGGDPVNRGSSTYYLDMLRTGQLGGMVSDIRSLVREGKRPPLLIGTLWKHWRRRQRLKASYPSWIDRDLEDRLALRSRWRQICAQEPIGWSIRAEITAPYWPFSLSSQDAGETGLLVEHRHPFFDLRVVRYMSSVPALPWCMQKLLLRKAMAGRLPAAIVARPKETLAGHPTDAFLAHETREWWTERLARAPAIERFINPGDLLKAVEKHFTAGTYDIDWLLRPVYLANWLHYKNLG